METWRKEDKSEDGFQHSYNPLLSISFSLAYVFIYSLVCLFTVQILILPHLLESTALVCTRGITINKIKIAQVAKTMGQLKYLLIFLDCNYLSSRM